jgi:hypothetical protein
VHASTWSSYWHNGFIYGNDINRGFDVFSLSHPSVIGAATFDRDNPQTQEVLFRDGDDDDDDAMMTTMMTTTMTTTTMTTRSVVVAGPLAP